MAADSPSALSKVLLSVMPKNEGKIYRPGALVISTANIFRSLRISLKPLMQAQNFDLFLPNSDSELVEILSYLLEFLEKSRIFQTNSMVIEAVLSLGIRFFAFSCNIP